MHRVRSILPWLSEFGWDSVVLAVDPEEIDTFPREKELSETVPDDAETRFVRPMSLWLTKWFGVRSPTLRSLFALYKEGTKILCETKIDLVFISTTTFPIMVLGKLWLKKYGIQFVLDYQDPWVSEHSIDEKSKNKPKKLWASRRLHKALEPWTLKSACGLVAVSRDYITQVKQRYRKLTHLQSITLPFAANDKDFEIASNLVWENVWFERKEGSFIGIYAGVLGPTMERTSRVLCQAIAQGVADNPELFKRLKLYFIGTDYSAKRRYTIRPIAREYGLEEIIFEYPARTGYFSVLRLLQDADFSLLIGSDNHTYTASKVFPYILSQKPALAIFDSRSSIVQILRETAAGEVAEMRPGMSTENLASQVSVKLTTLLNDLPFTPPTNWKAFQPYTAESMTRNLTNFFDDCLLKAPVR